MANGFNWQALDAGFSPMADQQTQPKKKEKNFWVDQISTAGGIIGGIGGGILGAAAGGFGAVPGAMAGSGAGSALGETLENFLTGEDDKFKNVAQEGLMGAAFGAGPIRGAKFALDAGKGLLAGGGKAAVKAASDEAAKFTVRGAVGQTLANKSGQFATKQFGLTDNFLAKYSKKYGEDAGKTITRYGINTADQADEIIKKQQGVFDELVKGAGDIPTKTFQTKLNTVGQELLTMGPQEFQQMGQKLLAETDQLVGQFGDKIPATALNKIRQQYDSLVNYTTRQANPAAADANKRVADVLRQTIQEASGSPELKKTGQELSRLYTLTDEIAKRAPQVSSRGSSPLGFRNLLAMGAGGAGGGVPGALAMGAATAAVNSPTGRRMLTNGAVSGAEKLIASGAKAAPKAMTPLGTATRIGGYNLAADAIGGATEAGATADPSQTMGLEDALMTGQSTSDGSFSNMNMPSINPASINSMNDMGASSQQMPQASSPYGKQDLLADIQRDPQNATKYIAYYQQLDEIFNSQAEQQRPLGVEAQKIVNNSGAGLRSLTDLETMIQRDPSLVTKAALPGSSLTDGLLGTSSYRAAIKNVQDAMSRLRSGASMTEQESARFDQMLPKFGDTTETIQYKIDEFKTYFRDANMNARGTSGPTTMEESLTQGYN